MAKPSGRYNVDDVCNKIKQYCEKSKKTVPILKECCLEYNWSYDYIIELAEKHANISQSIKNLYSQREIFYEKGAILGKINPTLAIFVLRQPCHGWTNREVDVNVKVERKDDQLSQALKNLAESLDNKDDE